MISLSLIFNKFKIKELEEMCEKGVELDINDGQIVGFRKTDIPTDEKASVNQ